MEKVSENYKSCHISLSEFSEFPDGGRWSFKWVITDHGKNEIQDTWQHHEIEASDIREAKEKAMAWAREMADKLAGG